MEAAFPRIEGELRAGAFRLSELAERHGTPLFVYDLAVVEDRYRAFTTAFAGADPLIAYSVKANGSLALVERLGALGAGADVTSQGELHRALVAGIPPERIVFAGVGKKAEEMEAALEAGILGFNVESAGELALLDEVARGLGVRAPFAARVNPDVLSPTPHEYTRTGHAASKFGVPVSEALELYRWARERSGLRAVGIDVHIGSQIVDSEPYVRALDRVLEIVAELRDGGVELEGYLDLGGGYGVGYDSTEGMDLEALAAEVVPRVRRSGLRLVLEPGRFLVGEAGVLLTRVLFVKDAGPKTFVITDGGMTELLRPSHYGGWHGIEPVVDPEGGRPERTVDVVGPICETGDFLARDRTMPLPEPGELLAVRTAGAYGFAMASNYNSRRRAAEVLVSGDKAFLVRRRETLEDLVRGEDIPDWNDP